MSYRQFTSGGYAFSEAASSLQKTIRRGIELEAMFWAVEFEEKFHNYLWQRLQIISVEDIGLAAPEAVLYVAEMRRLYAELRQKADAGRGRPSYRMVLANAILAMCRAPKCRIGDEFQIVVYGRRARGWKLDVPDYAHDMHTGTGRRKGRGQEHFWTEGVKLSNPAGIANPYTEEAKQIRIAAEDEPEAGDPQPPPKDNPLF